MTENGRGKSAVEQASGRDGVFVLVPSEEVDSEERQASFYLEAWRAVWQGKWIIVGITALFALASIAYALLATEWYRAEVLLMPAKARQDLPGELGGLASLAGLGGLVSDQTADSTEALALLRSRDFARDFINDLNLMPVLFAEQWNAEAKSWKSDDPEQQPDIREGIKYFTENVRSVVEDRRTGLVTLGVEWKDPEVAADWANLMVERINDRVRERALSEAEENAEYLRGELAQTNIVTLQQSISDLLENEYQTMMLARGNDEYAFRVVDPATPPKWRSRPRRTLLVIVATMGGGFLSLLVAFGRYRLAKAGSEGNPGEGAGSKEG